VLDNVYFGTIGHDLRATKATLVRLPNAQHFTILTKTKDGRMV
jgi:hypothetical protein